MHKASVIQVNAYMAMLIITIVGTGAVLLITHVANAVAENADSIASSYELPAEAK